MFPGAGCIQEHKRLPIPLLFMLNYVATRRRPDDGGSGGFAVRPLSCGVQG